MRPRDRARMEAYNSRKRRQFTIENSIQKSRNHAAGTGYDKNKGIKPTRKVKRDSVQFGGHDAHVRMEFATDHQPHRSRKNGLAGRTKQYKWERSRVIK